MGVKLSGIPARPVTAADLEGKTVAIDAPNLLYAFYAVQMLRAPPTPEAREHALRSATRGLAQRLGDLTAMGARSVVIFDGPPHPLKREVLDARNETRSFPAISADDYAPAKAAARACGTPVIDAKHDSEAQACAMARRGLVDVVATTDWDALAMGAAVLLRNLSANPRTTEGRSWSLVHAEGAFAHLNTDLPSLAGAAVLMGCDYFEGITRIGPAKAFAAMRAAGGDLDKALATLAVEGAAAERARAAHTLLREPPAHAVATLRWTPRDVEALLAAMDGRVLKRSVQAKLGG